ncbi:hypothetical protein CRE_06312 [Caenorhabditis remanei]|uniref:Uncharacterized protein n=1 Tax=Caenorhabditis remanei TaxID=31234 RepID=E3M179_CAERE|nr:hypothetical protein CRE_06312 [Caenorhabditis remanei]
MESKNSKSPDSGSPEQLRQPKEEPCELPESSIPTDYETFKQQQWEQKKQKMANMCMEQWSNYQSFPTQRWEGERVEPQLASQPTTQPTYFLDPNFGNPLTGLRGCLASVYQPLLAQNPRANEFDPRYPFGQYLYCPPSRSDAETSTVSMTGESSNQYLCFYENPTDEEFEKLKVFNSPLFGVNNDQFPDRNHKWKRRRMFNQFMEKLYKKNAETIDVIAIKYHESPDDQTKSHRVN